MVKIILTKYKQRGERMIHTFEVADNEEVKAIIYVNASGRIEVKAVKGTTQEELENMIAQLWVALSPSKN